MSLIAFFSEQAFFFFASFFSLLCWSGLDTVSFLQRAIGPSLRKNINIAKALALPRWLLSSRIYLPLSQLDAFFLLFFPKWNPFFLPFTVKCTVCICLLSTKWKFNELHNLLENKDIQTIEMKENYGVNDWELNWVINSVCCMVVFCLMHLSFMGKKGFVFRFVQFFLRCLGCVKWIFWEVRQLHRKMWCFLYFQARQSVFIFLLWRETPFLPQFPTFIVCAYEIHQSLQMPESEEEKLKIQHLK